MEPLHRIYEAVLSDEASLFFCVFILGWLIVGVLVVIIRPLASRQSGSKFIAMTPNALATLGVLGTFSGILIGLLDFDVNRIDASVPALLGGLKVAFSTSIVGIAAAIVFRLVRTVVPGESGSEGIGPEHILATLSEIRDDSRTASSRSADQLADLRNAISSDGDGSLLTQMQKLRTSIQDGQSELILEFRSFAEHMVENNQKAIIEALEQVIRDFNQKLTEQFGDNFKQLNQAVSELVVWQENYREHVETLERRLETSVEAIEASRNALKQVQDYAERIPESIATLEPVLQQMNGQTEVLSAQLGAIAALRDKAIEAFPVIETNLETITTRFSASVEDSVAKSQRSIEDSDKAYESLRLGYEGYLQRADDSREHFANELSKALKQMSDHSSQEFARHGQLIEQSAAKAQTSIDESWTQSINKMNEQFDAFDKQMQHELTRTIELLGKNLASVSEKLVSDYTPLTQRLRDLVNAAGAVS